MQNRGDGIFVVIAFAFVALFAFQFGITRAKASEHVNALPVVTTGYELPGALPMTLSIGVMPDFHDSGLPEGSILPPDDGGASEADKLPGEIGRDENGLPLFNFPNDQSDIVPAADSVPADTSDLTDLQAIRNAAEGIFQCIMLLMACGVVYLTLRLVYPFFLG